MQTTVQVVCTQGPSLRNRLMQDSTTLEEFGLTVVRGKMAGKNPGWSKLHSNRSEHGAINVRWDGPTRTLLCHVVTKGSGKPHAIIGDFVDYLLARFRGRIRTINVFPR